MQACNVGMMADMVGIEGLTYADPRYEKNSRQNMGKDVGSPRGLHRGVGGGCGWRG